MYYEIYIDQFAAEQFLISVLLLSICMRLQRRKVSWKRIAAGSLLNTVIAVLSICTGHFYSTGIGILAAGAAVFPIRPIRSFGKALLMLLFVTAVFFGVLNILTELLLLPVSIGSIGTFLIVKAVLMLFFKNRVWDGRLMEVHLCWENQKKVQKAIWDTGNQLTEPLTGVPVSIMEKETAYSLLGENWESRRGFYLIPYHSLGTRKSWMRGVALDALEVVTDGKTITVEHPVFAIYDGKVSSTGSYQVILHPKHSRIV